MLNTLYDTTIGTLRVRGPRADQDAVQQDQRRPVADIGVGDFDRTMRDPVEHDRFLAGDELVMVHVSGTFPL